jgi:hypothetical protein
MWHSLWPLILNSVREGGEDWGELSDLLAQEDFPQSMPQRLSFENCVMRDRQRLRIIASPRDSAGHVSFA